MENQSRVTEGQTRESRPVYEKPMIREMSEREILKEFQVTRSMAVWWTTGAC